MHKIKPRYLLLIILAIGVFLRFYKLEFQSLWYDELHSMNGSDPDLTIGEVIEYSRTDQPPFFFLLLHIWLKVFSFTDLAGRSFTALIGSIGILAMYALGKEVKDEEAGLVSALLTAVNYFHLTYSQEVRFYSLLFLVTTLSYIFFIKSIKKQQPKNFILYAIFTALTIYTQYFGLVVAGSQFLIFLFLVGTRKYNRTSILYAAASGVAILVLILPWVPQFLRDSNLVFWIEPVTFPRFLFAYFYNYFADKVLFYSLGILGLYFAFYHIRVWIKERIVLPVTLTVLILWIISGYGIPYIYSLIKAPMMVVRYTIIVLPAILAIFGVTITYITERWRPYILVTLALLSIRTIFFIQDHYTEIRKEQWREVAQEVIQDNKTPAVIFSYYAWHYNYYFKSRNSNFRATHPSSVDYQAAISNVNYVWLLQGHENNIGASREEVALIERNFERIKQVIFVGARGTLYKRKLDRINQ